jgi:hypothetical protein
MISEVCIHGNGIAATCCAKLLQRRAIMFGFQADESAGVQRPTLLINSQTQRLIGDVFEDGARLFAEAQPIRRRAVLWGSNANEARWFPHSGLAVRESALLARLWRNVRSGKAAGGPGEWQIHSSRPAPDRDHLCFGTRMATGFSVGLKDRDNDACFIESLADGWLFLVPAGVGEGSLIAVGKNPKTLLEESRLIGPVIAELLSEGTGFAAYPRIFVPLCESGWLACGTAAMGFDPICGEGAGHAVREAILAAAVLGAIHDGADACAALGQYMARLLAGFMRHLELCKQFYLSGRQSAWWDGEIAALDTGLAWTRAQLAAAPSPSSRLVGFDLVEIGRSAQQ